MSVWLAGVLVATALAVLVGAIALTARRRAAAHEARRVEALGQLAERLEASIGQIRAPRPVPVERVPSPSTHGPAPLVGDGLPGRAAFLDAVAAEIGRAGAGEARLTVALARVAGETTPVALLDAVREVTGRQGYALGPSSVAFALPGLGRAGGLGALARIEAVTAATGTAVERGTGETAVELVARLLETSPGSSGREPGPAEAGPGSGS